MKKRRSCTSNHSPLLRYSRTHEGLPVKTRSINDSKGRSLKRSPKLQQSSGQHSNKRCSKRNAFGSLESLFDVKKTLNLRDAYPLAYTFNYDGEKSVKGKSLATSDITKSESLIEILFLQSSLSHTSLERSAFKPVNIENAIEESKGLKTKVSNSAVGFQRNGSIYKSLNRSVKMAENDGEVLEEQKEESELVTENAVPATIEDLTKDKTEGAEDMNETEDKEEDEDTVQVDDQVDGEDKGKDEHEDESEDMSEKLITDEDVITELEVINERNAVLKEEIQQLKREVQELSQQPELTEEDTLMIKEKQDTLVLKVAELEHLTRKLQKVLDLTDMSAATLAKLFSMRPSLYDKLDEESEKAEFIRRLDDQPEIIEEIEAEKKVDREKRDIEAYKKIMEEDRFALPRLEYPEDKLPRIIVCGYTEDELPKIVVADNERKGRDKYFEKLTGKLTDSLTMQEKLVKENAQLEGGKYKLEEALLEKDTVVEGLQRKVCSLQAEMRIIVKENTELSRQLAALNQPVTSPTCCNTCPGVAFSPPRSTSPSLPSCPYAGVLFRDDVYCRCKCCLQSRFADTLSPTTGTACASPRLTGGASRTETRYIINNNVSGNVEMCSRGSTAVKALLPRGACPAELEDKLTSYGNNTKQLEQQLGSMECEVRNMQIELANVQRERQQLEQQRKLLKCTGPCAPCACCPAPPPTCVTPSSVLPLTSVSPKGPPVSTVSPAKMTTQVVPPMCSGSCTNALTGTSTCTQQQLRDLREQYARLQEDYKNKLCEVSCMRADAEKLKQDIRDIKEERERIEIKLIDAQERLKLLETEKGKFEGHKEQLVEQEQALMVAKKRFREAQDELDELRSLIQDQAGQLEDYRNKYLQAQQQVEEQRRQLDLMEMDNARMNENVTLEIGRVKNQFQEKLAELAPLPDILKQTQMKLQESQQMRLVAERNCEDLSRELLGCKDQVQTVQNQLDMLRTEHQALQDEKEHESVRFEELEKKFNELRHENERMKNALSRFEEQEAQLQKRIDEKMHENTQLSSMLEQIREDSARQVVRTKERCETIRRSMQGQIAEMERQLAQCRATARAAQRDRDEIRQKMQGQINNLNEAFEHAQGRIRSLQGHVNYLKTSYSNIFIGQGETPTGVLPGDTPGTGYDSCDCAY